MVEQRPRVQSRGYCSTLRQGHAIIFTTRDRPVPSARSWSAASMRPEEAHDRFVRRSESAGTSARRDAWDLLDRRGGVGALPGMYRDFLGVVADGPRTRVVTTIDGQEEQAYRDLLAQIDDG